MRTYEEVTIPERTQKRISETYCDLCGETIKVHAYSTDDVIVSKEIGFHYPDSGYQTIIEYDVCLKCFDDKIVPIFGNAKPTITERDW